MFYSPVTRQPFARFLSCSLTLVLWLGALSLPAPAATSTALLRGGTTKRAAARPEYRQPVIRLAAQSTSVVQFSAASYMVNEGDLRVTITVTRAGDTTGAATVDYRTAPDAEVTPCAALKGVASERCDYATSLDTLRFAAGETSKTFTVPIIDDARVEGPETFTISLSNATGAGLGTPATATVTINDNDPVPTLINPVNSTPFFVRQQYLDFLAREPEQGEPWSDILNRCPDVNNLDPNSPSAGCDRISVSAAFFGSPEFRLKGFYVFTFYRAAFGRLAEYAEIVLDLRAVTGQTASEVFQKRAQFAASFVERPEFRALYDQKTNAEYVAALLARYQLTAINTPDPANPDGTTMVTLTQADLVARLNGNTLTRAQVLRAIVQSQEVGAREFINAFVATEYYGYLRRTPEPAGYQSWLDYLSAHPGDFRTMVNGFMNSLEYKLRFDILDFTNRAPTVDAGPDRTVSLPGTLDLNGFVRDDGLPQGSTVSISWSKVSGPSSVVLSSASAAATAAIFNTPGSYVLRLTASDGQLTTSDDVTITISPDTTPPPPDPVSVAPPVDATVTTEIGAATAFLYSGPNPIQTGVAPGTIKPQFAAVLRGRVLDKSNQPLPNVTITILNHSEFGQTRSRADGMFDMAVNGGGLLTVNYAKSGFLPLQRQMDVPWQDYRMVHDVVLTPFDDQVTTIDLTALTPVQVARGTTMSDSSGQRRATLMFKQGTTATMTLPNGAQQSLPTLHVRATEYTVGPMGAMSMPGDLPPTSAYTYADDNSIDEAVAANAVQVTFSQPVVQYLENFLNFPVGTNIPLGSYDPQRAAWVTLANGRVVKILTITGGTANLDVVGNGQPATDAEYAALGINIAERQTLATLYAGNQSLWRLSLPHFTSKDANWPGGNRGSQASDPNGGPSGGGDPSNDPDCKKGSIIRCQSQTLGEAINLVGTPFTLNYSSDRTPGRQAEYTINIPLSGATVPSILQRIDLDVSVAGRMFHQSFPAAPNQTTTFTWDGKDAYGRTLQGKQAATVTVGFVYRGVYFDTVGFGYTSNGIPLLSNPTRREVTFLRVATIAIGAFDARGQGLGGWSLDVQHVYDPIGRTLYTGDGERQRVESLNRVIVTAGGTGSPGYSGEGGPATQAAFNFPEGLDLAPDGSAYIADVGNRVVRRIGTNGIVTTVAGTVGAPCSPTTDPCGDGGPAAAARFSAPVTVAFGPDGSYYVLDPGANKVRKVAPNGIITTVIGTGVVCSSPTDVCGDGGPAAQAKINNSQGLFVAPDGTIFLADTSARRIRRVGTDGIIATIAGNGNAGTCAVDNVPGRNACLGVVFGVVLAPDGTLYFSETQFNRVFKMGVDGILHVIAGNGSCGVGGDGGPATAAQLCAPEGIERGPDGSLYIADFSNARIRKIGPDGIINTVAGNGTLGFSGDGGAATAAMIRQSTEVKVGPDGSIWIADLNNHRIRRVNAPLPGFTNTDIAIPSADGSELYQFNPAGRHLRTVNTLTNTNEYVFGYDAAGHLLTVTDGDNNVTTIQRDGAGNATGILSPFNQTTALALDANGYLATSTNPAGESYQFTYSASGLMATERDPRGNQYQFTYNAMGRLTRDDDPATGFKTLARTDAGVNYDVLLTTALGRTTDYQVQQLTNDDQRRIKTLPSGLQTQRTIRANGTKTEQTPDGMVTNETLGPDPRWGMQAPITTNATVTTPGGLNFGETFARSVTLATSVNPLSLTSQTDTLNVNGVNYTSAYTSANRTFSDTTPLGRQRTTVIDALGRITQRQFANLNPASYAYDTRGRLASAASGTGGEARAASFSYNSNGFLSSITDPLGRSEAYTYDAAGRITQQTLADSRVIAYAYDAKGNLTSITPPGRAAHTFTFTPVDLASAYTPPNIGAGGGATNFTYNLDRDLTRITRPDAQQINFAYDTAGRLSTLTAPSGQYAYAYSATTGNLSGIIAPGSNTLAYDYDSSLLTRTTWSGTIAGNVSRTYDNFFRTAAQSINGANTVNFAYDNDSLLTGAGSLALARNAQNGLVTGTTLGNVTHTIGYNNFAEPTSYNAAFNGTGLYSTQYTRDKLGRITQQVETIGGVTNTYTYAYDPAGRLTGTMINGGLISYTYDSNSNRLTRNLGGLITNGAYDNQDRLTQYGTTTYAYTANGELQSKTNGGQTTQYAYDALGNLRNVTLPAGTQIDYVIDGQNRRIGRKVNGTLTQGFLYQDQLAPVAELDGNLNLVSRFVYGSRANVPDYMVKNGVTYRLITDHLGSVRLVVDAATGVIAQRIDYDEFGVVLMDTNPGFQPFGFAGGLYDPQTKLVRFGARDYDAETGRWTAKDSIFFNGKQANLYGYAFSDPLNFRDSSGLSPTSVAGDYLGGNLKDAATKYVGDQVTDGIKQTSPDIGDRIDQIRDVTNYIEDNLKDRAKTKGRGEVSKFCPEALRMFDKIKRDLDIARDKTAQNFKNDPSSQPVFQKLQEVSDSMKQVGRDLGKGIGGLGFR